MAGFNPVGSTPVASIGGAAGPSLTVTGSPPSALTIGVSSSFHVTASGGTGPYTYAILSGSLPPGLTLDSALGIVSGYPTTVGTYTFAIKATDAVSVTGNTGSLTTVVQSYAAYPGKIVTDSNIGPYNTDIRTPYGYGVPPGSGPVRASWFGLEVLHSGSPSALVSWFGLEVLHSGSPFALVSWFGIEVLRSIADKSTPRPVPPRHVTMPPQDTTWLMYVNQRRKGGAPKPKRPVQYTIV